MHILSSLDWCSRSLATFRTAYSLCKRALGNAKNNYASQPVQAKVLNKNLDPPQEL